MGTPIGRRGAKRTPRRVIWKWHKKPSNKRPTEGRDRDRATEPSVRPGRLKSRKNYATPPHPPERGGPRSWRSEARGSERKNFMEGAFQNINKPPREVREVPYFGLAYNMRIAGPRPGQARPRRGRSDLPQAPEPRRVSTSANVGNNHDHNGCLKSLNKLTVCVPREPTLPLAGVFAGAASPSRERGLTVRK